MHYLSSATRILPLRPTTRTRSLRIFSPTPQMPLLRIFSPCYVNLKRVSHNFCHVFRIHIHFDRAPRDGGGCVYLWRCIYTTAVYLFTDYIYILAELLFLSRPTTIYIVFFVPRLYIYIYNSSSALSRFVTTTPSTALYIATQHY